MDLAANTGLVYKQLHRFNLADDQDAESAAFEALYKASLTYDKGRDTAFSTYATACIYNALAQILRARRKKSKLEVISYEECIPGTEDLCLLDTLTCDNDPSVQLEAQEHYDYTLKAIDACIGKFSGKALAVLKLWKESEFTLQQVELASKCHVTQAYVSDTIRRYRHYLRMELAEYHEGSD